MRAVSSSGGAPGASRSPVGVVGGAAALSYAEFAGLVPQAGRRPRRCGASAVLEREHPLPREVGGLTDAEVTARPRVPGEPPAALDHVGLG
ncbi:hypothetical protein ACH5AO_17095 [Streptomyces sp. NPDC018964]|uniref:hypothetical protein n=1 Tax=unclassified Streptomyces TaxID=2593676 RepID=UPI0037B2EDEF